MAGLYSSMVKINESNEVRAESVFKWLFCKHNVEFLKMCVEQRGTSMCYVGYYLDSSSGVGNIVYEKALRKTRENTWCRGVKRNEISQDKLKDILDRKYGGLVTWRGGAFRKEDPLYLKCEIHGNFKATYQQVVQCRKLCPECISNKLRAQRPERKGVGNNGAINWFKLMRDDDFANETAVLYLVRITTKYEKFYKVGISSPESFYFRLKRIEKYPRSNVELLQYTETTRLNSYEIEQHILNRVQQYTPNHKVEGYTEMFKSSILDYSDLTVLNKRSVLTDDYYHDKRLRYMEVRYDT